MDDAVAAREQLLAAFSRVAPARAFKEPEYDRGSRGAVQRARQHQQDLQDLQEWIERYGKRLPGILIQLEALDTELRADPSMASARLAARHGAPAIQSEVPAYVAKMQQKEQQKAYERREADVVKGIQLAQQHGLLPSDEESMAEIAVVLQHPHFQFGDDAWDALQRAAGIVAHPNHVWSTPCKDAPKKRDAGRKSIGGAPNVAAAAPRGARGTGGVKDSIARVRAAMG
jgi:hypothetical protein